MLLKFTTKRDANGNRYTLVIDTEAKTVQKDYNPYSIWDYIEITKKERNALYDNAIENGYNAI